MEIIAKRSMNISYPIIDSIFILFLIGLLIVKKKYRALVWSLFGGLLYFFVDYVLFHLVAESRFITAGYPMGWILLWMSMSYGITNFLFIWLALEKDEHLIGWGALIFIWWIACPQISDMFAGTAPSFEIWRTTSRYHGIMGIILFVSYAALIIFNMSVPKYQRVNIVWLFLIGVIVQFGWEFSLLISGIRSEGFSLSQSLRTMAVNSLTETNLGMPAMFLIFVYANRYLDKKKALLLGIDARKLMAGKTYDYRTAPVFQETLQQNTQKDIYSDVQAESGFESKQPEREEQKADVRVL